MQILKNVDFCKQFDKFLHFAIDIL